MSSLFLQGTRPRFASGTLMSLSDDTAFLRWDAVRVRPRFPDAPSGCQPGRSPMRSEERVERPGDGCPCVGAEETCGARHQKQSRTQAPQAQKLHFKGNAKIPPIPKNQRDFL